MENCAPSAFPHTETKCTNATFATSNVSSKLLVTNEPNADITVEGKLLPTALHFRPQVYRHFIVGVHKHNYPRIGTQNIDRIRVPVQ